eukprot:3778406-Alexandrium_andersonii.AAC.1
MPPLGPARLLLRRVRGFGRAHRRAGAGGPGWKADTAKQARLAPRDSGMPQGSAGAAAPVGAA